jgi:hypothetical protein
MLTQMQLLVVVAGHLRLVWLDNNLQVQLLREVAVLEPHLLFPALP